jgi:glyoxylase-like metal-dependent hydrolase (beta-lactamase superfamily II)
MSPRTTTQSFFDPSTGTVSYGVADSATRAAAVIDPVPDFGYRSGRADARSADQVLWYLRGQQLRVEWILETHAHADHACLHIPLDASPGLAAVVQPGPVR